MSRARREGDETPWASFSDALSGMLFVFVITTFWFALRLAVEQQNLQTQKAAAAEEVDRLTKANAVAADLVELEGGAVGRLTECLQSGGVLDAEGERETKRVSLYPKSLEVGWFDDCSANLSPALQSAVDKVRACVSTILVPMDQDYRVKVMLEGHTDARQVAGACRQQFPSNWELSGARAAAVTRAVLDGGSGASGGENSVRAELEAGDLQVLAVGMGDTVAAWKAICRGARGDPMDIAVCRVMTDHAADPVGAAQEMGAMDFSGCHSDTPAAAGLQPLLRIWANWCGSPGRADEKRRRLRRVDLRIELEPRAVLQPAQEAR